MSTIPSVLNHHLHTPNSVTSNCYTATSLNIALILILDLSIVVLVDECPAMVENPIPLHHTCVILHREILWSGLMALLGRMHFFLGAYVLFFPSFFTPSFFWSKSQIASSEDWVIFAYRNITLFYLHSWLIVWPEIDFWVENHFSLKIWRHCSAIVLCCW